MQDVYSLQPINKTAAIVTSQSCCAVDDTLTDEQLRENLVSRLKSMEIEILSLKKGSKERKRLGKEKAVLCNEINKIRASKRAKGVENYFMDVCRIHFTKAEFDILMKKAVARMNEFEGITDID